MNFETLNRYMVCEPYLTDTNNNSLIITNEKDTECLARIVRSDRKDLDGRIIMYDIDKCKKYTIKGKQYIIVNQENVIAFLQEDENNG